MSLEVAVGIWQFDRLNPVGGTDKKKLGDDHIRMMKGAILNTWANVQGNVTASHTEMNYLVGVTSPVIHNAVKNVANGVGGLDVDARLGNAQMPTDPSFTTVRVTSTVGADLASAGGIQIGASSAFNLALSHDRILARNNGAGSHLYIGDKGDGGVTVGNPTTGGAILLYPGVPGGYEAQLVHGGKVVTRTTTAGLYVGMDSQARAEFVADLTGSYWGSLISDLPSRALGMNSSAVLTDLLYMDPNGAVTAFYNGVAAHRTITAGIELLGTANAATFHTVNGTRKGTLVASPTDFSIIAEAGTSARVFVRNAGDTAYNQGLKVDNAGAVYVGPAETELTAYVRAANGSISKYTSADTSIVGVTLGQFTHGLGATPDHYSLRLKCTSTHLGYAVGDEIDISTVLTAGDVVGKVYSVWANATQIGWSGSGAIPIFYADDKTSSSGVAAIDTSKWVMVARAVRYL